MRSLSRRSMIRFVKHQLLAHYESYRFLIPDRYFAFRFAGGRVYWNLKESSMMMCRALGKYEPETDEAVVRFLKPGATFLDIGGNKGDFALLAAKVVGERGSVLCFEPEPTNRYWIEQSIRLNGYKNIRVLNFAVSDHDGQAELYLGTKSGFHSLFKGLPDRDAGVIQVPTRALDSFLGEIRQPAVDMMKIDVEGAELLVLEGARRTLEENRSIIVLLEIHAHLGVQPREVFKFLRELGFSVFRMESPFDLPARDELSSANQGLAYRVVAYR